MSTEFTPIEGSIILGPDHDNGVWYLAFTDAGTGEEVRINLPDEQLREMDQEFTGLPGA